MKHIKLFEQFINESVKKYDGLEIYPDWIDPRDFGDPVNNISQLKKGVEYILHEPGMNVWQAEYTYQGKRGSSHLFTSSNDGPDMEYTENELKAEIKDNKIYHQSKMPA